MENANLREEFCVLCLLGGKHSHWTLLSWQRKEEPEIWLSTLLSGDVWGDYSEFEFCFQMNDYHLFKQVRKKAAWGQEEGYF